MGVFILMKRLFMRSIILFINSQLANSHFFQNLPRTWLAIVNVLENWEPRFRHKIVRWMHPPDGWYKCNTDCASKGNPGLSSAAFV